MGSSRGGLRLERNDRRVRTGVCLGTMEAGGGGFGLVCDYDTLIPLQVGR